MNRQPTPPLDTPPRWAWACATLLLGAAVVVLVAGRGGAAVFAGAALAFGAIAVLLLSMPDRLADEE